jgi:hypothetical protein
MSLKLRDSIEELDISVRCYNALKHINILTIGDLVAISESELRDKLNKHFLITNTYMSKEITHIYETIGKNELMVSISKELIDHIIKYCEDQAIYDKLGKYGDFYYKLKRLIT